jgi:hypothetical protein
VSAKWPAALVPPAGTHGCLLASVHARLLHPVGGRHVWEDNSLAQKNLTIVSLARGRWTILPVVIGNFKLKRTMVDLELRRPRGLAAMRVSILFPKPRSVDLEESERLDCGAEVPGTDKAYGKRRSAAALAERLFEGALEETIGPGRSARHRLLSKTGFPLVIGLRLEVPRTAKPGNYVLDLVQLDAKGKVAGGIAVMLRVRR